MPHTNYVQLLMALLELLIATRNPGKLTELNEVFATLPLRLLFLNDFQNISNIAEVGHTYQENATLKAVGYSEQTGLAALADDSGLEVDALGGRPGVLSARFGGSNLSDVERTRALLSALLEVGPTKRTARFVCCMVLYGSLPRERARTSQPEIVAVSRGVCEGVLAMEPSGMGGFGFDPIFIPSGYNVPFAALDPTIKKKVSHRAQAAKFMQQDLKHLLVQT